MRVNIPVPNKIPYTKEGFEKVQKDYDLLLKKRKEILVRLQAAREMGDLSENGAYTSAKFELRSTDREIRQLKFLLKFGVITPSNKGGVIDFGSTVTLFDGKDELTFTMVSGYESDPTKQKLSVYSPLGKSIVGKHIGEKVTINTPDGLITYKIIKVS